MAYRKFCTIGGEIAKNVMIDEDFRGISARRDELIHAHDELRNSPEFTAQVVFLDRLTSGFLQGAVAAWLAATRHHELIETSLVLRRMDDLIESALAIYASIHEGIHSPARRERRYVLESLAKYLYVDRQKPTSSFKDRLTFFHSSVERAPISVIDKVNFEMLSEQKAQELRAEVVSEYKRLSAYVHPSTFQLREKITNASQGRYLGFETAKQFERLNRETFRLYDITLALLFHAIGPSFTGDLFVRVFDEDTKWKFHKGKYVKLISSNFDYKLERRNR